MNKRLKTVLPLSFAFLVISAFTVQNAFNKNWIKWDAKNKLEWSDFKGNPIEHSSFGALSGTGFFYELEQTSETDFDFTVYSYFNKEMSWVNKDERSDELLAHEQLHFDLTELHTRKFRKALMEYSYTKSDRVEKVAGELFKKFKLQLNTQHDLYDRESYHSIDKAEQRKWSAKVPIALERYEVFKVHEFSITAAMRRE